MSATGKTKRRIHPGPKTWVAIGLFFVALDFAGLFATDYVADAISGLPEVPRPADIEVSSVVLDRDGHLLRPFTTDEGRWRLPVDLSDVDPQFINMLIAYEDGRFYEHDGVDWLSMVRAGLQFAGAGGHVVSGGSTLTMQVARLADEAQSRSLATKLRQIAFAQKLEAALSKDQILDLYLELAPYGGNIEGVRAASLTYFGKEPARLTIAEAALLVALPQSPEARRPDRDPDAARAARDRVLDRLVLAGALDVNDAEAAKREPIPTARRDFPMLAPHLTLQAIAANPEAETVRLTLEAPLQARLERLVAAHAAELGPKVSAAVLVADLTSGEVLASVGSPGLFDDERDGHVDMTRAERSPGSTLKPLIYGLAFELGLAHPESLITDRPTGFSGYVPANFDGFNRGTVTIREALTQSLNVPAVLVLDAVGPARLLARLKRAGVTPILPGDSAPGLAIGLGGVGITLRELVSLYGAIAREGAPMDLIDGVNPDDGRTLQAPVLDKVAAWYVSDILADVLPPQSGSPGRIAFKTGTSYGYRDAWAIGFDGKTVIGVWVGRPDGVPVPGITGIGTAAPLLFESFDRLGAPSAPLPGPPAGAILTSNADLPDPLRRFRHPEEDLVAASPAPEIAFPANGVDVDLGLSGGMEQNLAIKVRNGAPPFTYYANGTPFARTTFARQANWQPDGPGFVTLSVVDASGKSDSVVAFLQ